MYIATNQSNNYTRGILDFMPRPIRRHLYGINLSDATEIRLRLGKPLTIHYPDGSYYIGAHDNLTMHAKSALRITRANIDEAIEIATASSVYSVKDEIKNGFVTIRGGHRIGITGSAVIKEDKVSFIKDISALNYRIAREVKGAADAVIPLISDGEAVKNTLIISPPGAGKTTMLRDIARQLSYSGKRVSIVDERREIAALFEGRSVFDLGINTDVLEGVDKPEGMKMVLRSMNPEVIITDEIGTQSDIDAIKKISCSGAAVIASVHGKNLKSIMHRTDLAGLTDYFDLAVTLSSRNGAGTIEGTEFEW